MEMVFFKNLGGHFSTSRYWIGVVNCSAVDSAIYLNNFGFVYFMAKHLSVNATTRLLIVIRVKLRQTFSVCIYAIFSGRVNYAVHFLITWCNLVILVSIRLAIRNCLVYCGCFLNGLWFCNSAAIVFWWQLVFISVVDGIEMAWIKVSKSRKRYYVF